MQRRGTITVASPVGFIQDCFPGPGREDLQRSLHAGAADLALADSATVPGITLQTPWAGWVRLAALTHPLPYRPAGDLKSSRGYEMEGKLILVQKYFEAHAYLFFIIHLLHELSEFLNMHVFQTFFLHQNKFTFQPYFACLF